MPVYLYLSGRASAESPFHGSLGHAPDEATDKGLRLDGSGTNAPSTLLPTDPQWARR